jgi:hypothetical protein
MVRIELYHYRVDDMAKNREKPEKLKKNCKFINALYSGELYTFLF